MKSIAYINYVEKTLDEVEELIKRALEELQCAPPNSVTLINVEDLLKKAQSRIQTARQYNRSLFTLMMNPFWGACQ
jgi:prefoldin subunit 5